MEEETAPPNPGSIEIALQIYIALLGVIEVSIIALTLAALMAGISEIVVGIYFVPFSLILYPIAHTLLFIPNFGAISLSILSIFLVLITTISLAGAFHKKKWGRQFNLVFLGFFFPVFIIFPTAIASMLPHAEILYSISAMLLLALSLWIFDAYYFFWFLLNKKKFA